MQAIDSLPDDIIGLPLYWVQKHSTQSISSLNTTVNSWKFCWPGLYREDLHQFAQTFTASTLRNYPEPSPNHLLNFRGPHHEPRPAARSIAAPASALSHQQHPDLHLKADHTSDLCAPVLSRQTHSSNELYPLPSDQNYRINAPSVHLTLT